MFAIMTGFYCIIGQASFLLWKGTGKYKQLCAVAVAEVEEDGTQQVKVDNVGSGHCIYLRWSRGPLQI